jgi:hypothetical protein
MIRLSSFLTVTIIAIAAVIVTAATLPAVNTVCPISQQGVDGSGPTVQFSGQTVEFCCGRCVAKWASLDDQAKASKFAAVAPQDKGGATDAPKEMVLTAYNVYLLESCPISGRPVSSTSPVAVVGDRQIRFCCNGCTGRFTGDADAKQKVVDTLIKEQQRDTYPVQTCVVAGGKLGSMGQPVEIVWGNRLVRYCCGGCDRRFKANPQKYLEQLDAAVIKAQGPDYPVTTCPIGGGELGDNAVDVVLGDTLVRLCCGGCTAKLLADPIPHIKAVKAARAKAAG